VKDQKSVRNGQVSLSSAFGLESGEFNEEEFSSEVDPVGIGRSWQTGE
jgi:hypothetical protein